MPMPMKPEMGGDMGGAPQEAPQGPEQGAPDAKGGQEEIINAIQTLQTFILGQKEQGNPQAGEMAQAFATLLKSMQAGGGEQPEEKPEAPPEEAPPEDGSGGGNAMPMNSKKGAVPIM